MIRVTGSRSRVLGYKGAEVALDEVQNLEVSNPWAAIAAGLAMVLVTVTLGLGALLARERNPLRALGQLVRGPDGAYSLSNLQILTTLVICDLRLLLCLDPAATNCSPSRRASWCSSASRAAAVCLHAISTRGPEQGACVDPDAGSALLRPDQR